MRDFVALIVAVILAVVALSMATSLKWYRRAHTRRRQQILDQGRSVVAEIPTDDGLAFFAEDDVAFYWDGYVIAKDLIKEARVLINGAPISAIRSRRFPSEDRGASLLPDDGLQGFERERWDVAIETLDDSIIVACGSIRERVSQELARAIFEAVKNEIATRDAG